MDITKGKQASDSEINIATAFDIPQDPMTKNPILAQDKIDQGAAKFRIFQSNERTFMPP